MRPHVRYALEIAATLAALAVGFYPGVMAMVALAMADSGGGAVDLPVAVAAMVGGAIMGAIGGAPLAYSRRRWFFLGAGAAVFALVGAALSPFA
ncbi:MAG TPA: hypothetical protein VE549_14375 [Myxococcaceae bacterium]|jgi:hypothetical protein|nr:hypothetical protein [Myxococcaceae bacterium]